MSEGGSSPHSLSSRRQGVQGDKEFKTLHLRQKGGIYVKEGDVEVDAADHSVGHHGRTHGTGSHLVHGYVDKE